MVGIFVVSPIIQCRRTLAAVKNQTFLVYSFIAKFDFMNIAFSIKPEYEMHLASLIPACIIQQERSVAFYFAHFILRNTEHQVVEEIKCHKDIALTTGVGAVYNAYLQ